MGFRRIGQATSSSSFSVKSRRPLQIEQRLEVVAKGGAADHSSASPRTTAWLSWNLPTS